MSIDPAASTPPWKQLAQILRERISSGDLAPGEKIPSLAELEDESGLSTNTVRKAIAKLKEEGLLTSVHGLGVFVVDPLPTAK